ncbi:ABC transporter permease [Ancylobacter pratisalsi]|uniref:ABC transporter permease n=1 Tax=Ancylobacter pratisalsi TaxID=1745854 RepID=A0A6P1YNX6_9HYPH|nr:ABC transporter permease [Ancylobacter pratisalsi]QIB34600.1 ABC transporter permease [Ancylobacter pratisalsi]
MNGPMFRYLRTRCLQSLIVICLIIVGSFFLLRLVPGDMVDIMAGQQGDMDATLMATLRARYGLDQPVLIQLYHYVGGIVQGDLGYSYRNSTSVLSLILQRLPATGLLVICSVFVAVFVGTLAGVVSARHAHRPLDIIVSMVVLLFYATPIFLSGLALMLIFSVKLKWLPLAGLTTPGVELGVWGTALDITRHMILPVVSLSLFYIAIYTRLARASMLQVLDQDYIRTAHAKGLSTTHVILGHALRNALLPVVTMVGLQVAELFGGAVLTETIFGLPGIGRLAYDAVFQRDYPLILGILIVCAFVTIFVNLAIDVVYTLLDPRVKIAR